MSREKKINQKTDVRVKDEDAVKYKEIYDAIIEYEKKFILKMRKELK